MGFLNNINNMVRDWFIQDKLFVGPVGPAPAGDPAGSIYAAGKLVAAGGLQVTGPFTVPGVPGATSGTPSTVGFGSQATLTPGAAATVGGGDTVCTRVGDWVFVQPIAYTFAGGLAASQQIFVLPWAPIATLGLTANTGTAAAPVAADIVCTSGSSSVTNQGPALSSGATMRVSSFAYRTAATSP